ncbi:hypothetical protein F66182_3432 [Fusarium sp. NRRL 66182]|nr:hypothetical protein F66182_3432 [Fusarium sp. NRRL 66182]
MLENQIVAMMQGPIPKSTDSSNPVHPPNAQPSAQPKTVPGNLVSSSVESTYVSSSHWVAILNNISELKEQTQWEEYTQPESEDSCEETTRIGIGASALLFRSQASCSKEDLVAALPSRPVVDRLVSEYFHDLDMMPHTACVHKTVFYKEYEAFWKSPLSVSAIWLGLLYAVVCLSSHFGSAAANLEPETEWSSATSSSLLYLEQVVQCLMVGNYRRGGPYVIETLAHYFVIEHLRRPDTEVDSWLLLGVINRLALRMGYHRDPSHFPGMTPFQGEMRRRVWAMLHSADAMLAMQLGVPRMFHEGQWDTREPLILSDDEFDDTCLELPRSRLKDDELGPSVYVVSRIRMAKVLGIVVDMINTTQRIPSQVSKAERLMQETYDSLPPALKLSSDVQSLSESPTLMLQQCFLAIMLYQAQLLLFQDCLSGSDQATDPGHHDHCLAMVLNAALNTLELQSYMGAAKQTGGALWPLRWKLTSTTLAHEFLLATTVLSKALFSTIGPNPLVQLNSDIYDRILSTLRHTRDIWLQSVHRSNEARKVASMLTALFNALEERPLRTDLLEREDMAIDLERYFDLNFGEFVLESFLE